MTKHPAADIDKVLHAKDVYPVADDRIPDGEPGRLPPGAMIGKRSVRRVR